MHVFAAPTVLQEGCDGSDGHGSSGGRRTRPRPRRPDRRRPTAGTGRSPPCRASSFTRDRRRPRQAAVRRLREVDVRWCAHRVPVLVRQVDVARVGRARGEVLDDPVAEVRVRERAVRVLDRRRRDHERGPRDAVVGRLRHVDVADAVLVLRVEAADEGDVDVPVRVDRRIDVGVRRRRRSRGVVSFTAFENVCPRSRETATMILPAPLRR